MAQTWTHGSEQNETCPKCNSIYRVTTFRLPTRDSDYFDCQVCGDRIREWNDTEVPSFTLIQRGQHKESENK
ncbi:hypothetical protein NIES2111_58430 (plasmid) [Nostoc sp. NIES-2111]|nr:hypothetical protein NIES2111_58430 [Nostoc sp. NIES-2111]